jgi:hypothetical protein
LVHLGQALALDGHAPTLTEQLDWVTGTLPVPAAYQAALALTRGSFSHRGTFSSESAAYRLVLCRVATPRSAYRERSLSRFNVPSALSSFLSKKSTDFGAL